MPSDPDDDKEAEVGAAIAGETTRLEAVTYLAGVSGHGVLSLCFSGGAVLLLLDGRFGMAFLTVVIAYGIAINGLSIYFWDELRVRFKSTSTRDADPPTRTLSPPRVSPEMKAEVAAGAVLLVGITLLLGVAVGVLRTVGPRQAVTVGLIGLVLGNTGALAWTYTRP